MALINSLSHVPVYEVEIYGHRDITDGSVGLRVKSTIVCLTRAGRVRCIEPGFGTSVSSASTDHARLVRAYVKHLQDGNDRGAAALEADVASMLVDLNWQPTLGEAA